MIPGLDGIRALAFLLVFSDHADYIYIGWAGVQLFFVLSGFLITGILLRTKEQFRASDYFKKFYGRRVLRIFPLYYFYLLFMLLLTAALIYFGYRVAYMERYQEHLPYALFFGYNFYIASPAFSGDSWLIGHLWSLSAEEQFYLLWPLIILLTPKKYLKTLFLAGIAAGPLFRLGMTALYKYTDAAFLSSNMALAIYVLSFSQIDAFAFGAYITRFEIPKARLQFFILLLLLPIIGLATYYYSNGDLGPSTALGFNYPLGKDLKQVWGYSYLAYLFALFIYLVVREKMFLHFLENKFIQHLGRISYGAYVYHFAVIWFVRRIRDFGIPESAAKPLTLVIAAIATYAIATLSYKYLEKPILDLKDRFFPLRRESNMFQQNRNEEPCQTV